MSQYMLMFSLGPVQTFIAQARKTRDLWLGSYFLSKLMEAAMKDIEKIEGKNADNVFVFPTKRTIKDDDIGRGDIPDIPNKYIAIFDKQKGAEMAAKQSIDQIEGRWAAICREIRERILNKGNISEETNAIWERQTDSKKCFEFFWVVVQGDPTQYQKWLRDTQRTFNARKSLRDFFPQDEPGEKSTISGEREALRSTGTQRSDVRNFWIALTLPGFISTNDISKTGSERLDAIDTIKRFALHSSTLTEHLEKGIDFPSTSSVATAFFIKKLLDIPTQLPEIIQWRQATKNLAPMSPRTIPYLWKKAGSDYEWILKRDGDLYFPEAFTPHYLRENYNINTNENHDFIPSGLAAQAALLKAVGTHPTPYYAIVQMDGDRMGIILNGVSGLDKHKEISAALSNFARGETPKIVEEDHPGRLIYAGGDDVLALTPLEGMLGRIDALQKQYQKIVRAPVAGDETEKLVTASIGVAIAHHFVPLSHVLRAARDAEKLAKNHYGRDAVVITVMRHSGEQTRVGCHWYYEFLHDSKKQGIEPLLLFFLFQELLTQDVLSPKCIHILLEEAPALVGLSKEGQQSEIRRVLLRQRNNQKKDQLPDDSVQMLANWLITLAEAMDAAHKGEKKSTELHSDKRRYGLVEVLGWLLVMAFLARKDQE